MVTGFACSNCTANEHRIREFPLANRKTEQLMEGGPHFLVTCCLPSSGFNRRQCDDSGSTWYQKSKCRVLQPSLHSTYRPTWSCYAWLAQVGSVQEYRCSGKSAFVSMGLDVEDSRFVKIRKQVTPILILISHRTMCEEPRITFDKYLWRSHCRSAEGPFMLRRRDPD